MDWQLLIVLKDVLTASITFALWHLMLLADAVHGAICVCVSLSGQASPAKHNRH